MPTLLRGMWSGRGPFDAWLGSNFALQRVEASELSFALPAGQPPAACRLPDEGGYLDARAEEALWERERCRGRRNLRTQAFAPQCRQHVGEGRLMFGPIVDDVINVKGRVFSMSWGSGLAALTCSASVTSRLTCAPRRLRVRRDKSRYSSLATPTRSILR